MFCNFEVIEILSADRQLSEEMSYASGDVRVISGSTAAQGMKVIRAPPRVLNGVNKRPLDQISFLVCFRDTI